MSHVFISYSKKNRDYARKLADHLLLLGFDVWIDDRIDYGSDWWRTIVRAIRNASAFIVIMTDESDASEWVQREVTIADKNKIPPFPLWLSGDFHASENWAIYVRTHYANVTDGSLPLDDFYTRLAQAAPRKPASGINVTPAMAEPSSAVTDPELAHEIATPPKPDTVAQQRMILSDKYVFISHSRKNHDYALALAHELLSHGFDVWLDDRITYGDIWEDQAVAHCAAFLVIMTPDSEKSGRVKHEIEYATHLKKPQFPILLMGQAFLHYMSTQYLDVRNGNLPDDDFYRWLARAVPRKPIAGTNVTVASVTESNVNAVPVILSRRVNLRILAAMVVVVVGLLLAGFALFNRQPVTVTNTPTLTQQLVQESTELPTIASTPSITPTPTFMSALPLTPSVTTNMPFIISKSNVNVRSGPSMRFDPPLGALSPNEQAEILAQTPDGKWLKIAYLGNTGWVFATLVNVSGDLSQLPLDAGPPLPPTSTPTLTPVVIPIGGGTGEIAFVSTRDGNPSIFLMNVDGTNLRRLTNNNFANYSPAWSPDGKRIAFASNRDDGKLNIYVMDANGTNLRSLTTDAANDSSPTWSPDGKQIAFASDRSGGYQIYIMDVDGNNVKQLTNNTIASHNPAWSLDGERIAYEAGLDSVLTIPQLHIVNVDGSNDYSLGSGSKLAWAPNQNIVIFNSRIGSTRSLSVSNVDGSNRREIPLLVSYVTGISWSPDGKWIASDIYRSFKGSIVGTPTPTPNPSFGIFIFDLNGENLQLLPNTSSSDSDPVWRPKITN